jgi:23S rRNA-/tRNA-specific pseudouridylate synthase
MFKSIDRFPFTPLILGAFLLGLVPFVPEPHLVEKVKMLLGGTLSQPADIFDLCMHGSLPLILAVKLIRLRGRAAEK